MLQVRGELALTWPWLHPTVSEQHPSVFPLVPCRSSISTGDTSVTFGCLIKDYIPEPVNVTWDVGSLEHSVTTLPGTLDSILGLYTTISQVTTASAEWATQKFTCSVEHAGDAPVKKIVHDQTGRPNCSQGPAVGGQRECWVGGGIIPGIPGPLGSWEVRFRGSEEPTTGPPPVPPVCAANITQPTVKLYHSSCNPNGNTQTTIQLLCLISDFTPGKIEVTWLVDGHVDNNMFSYTSPAKQEHNLSSVVSQLNITQGEWVSQKTYTCQVYYQGCTFKKDARSCPGTVSPC